MSKVTYWVTGKPAHISIAGGVLHIDREGNQREQVGLAALSQLIVSGQHQLDARVLLACAQNEVSVLLLDRRARSSAWLGASPAAQAKFRIAQHSVHRSLAMRQQMARVILAAKFESQAKSLEQMGCNAAASELLSSFQTRLDACESMDALRGVEGAAAAWYWRCFAQHVPQPFQFVTRARRPPPDPVNACLSLAYTSLNSRVQPLLEAMGFDLALGFLHDIAPARCSLTLDLVEPLRAGADLFVLKLLTQLEQSHFRLEPSRGCYLSQAGQRAFFAHFAALCKQWILPTRETPGQTLDAALRGYAQHFRAAICELDRATREAVDHV
jgi:CRISPR-associated protein Cas1